MTDTITRPTTYHDLNGYDMAPLRDAYLTWRRQDVSEEIAETDWRLVSEAAPSRYSSHLNRFLTWLNEDDTRWPVPPVTAEPIGPSTPGWDAWWARLAEYAEEDGYEEQYNTLARAFSAAELADEDNEERDFYVDVRIESFLVSIPVTSTRRRIEGDIADLDQVTIDDAVRNWLNNNDVSYDVVDHEEA